jgi:hypothetical protein
VLGDCSDSLVDAEMLDFFCLSESSDASLESLDWLLRFFAALGSTD